MNVIVCATLVYMIGMRKREGERERGGEKGTERRSWVWERMEEERTKKGEDNEFHLNSVSAHSVDRQNYVAELSKRKRKKRENP